MNRLPDELIPYIFQHLHIVDLLNCRLVSKRFRYFSYRVKIKEIVIIDPMIKKIRGMKSDLKGINEKDLVYMKFTTSRMYRWFLFDLSNLKRLTVHITYVCSIYDLDHLLNKRFNKLVHLEICLQGLHNYNDDVLTLNLPFLQYFKLRNLSMFHSYNRFLIIAPNLITFITEIFGPLVQIQYSKSIRNLEFNRTKNLTDEYLSKFTNVVCLKLNSFSFIRHLHESPIRLLPNLEMIYLNMSECDLIYRFHQTKNYISTLTAEKRSLNKGLRLFFDDQELRDELFENHKSINFFLFLRKLVAHLKECF